jgi:hypothetical protein
VDWKTTIEIGGVYAYDWGNGTSQMWGLVQIERRSEYKFDEVVFIGRCVKGGARGMTGGFQAKHLKPVPFAQSRAGRAWFDSMKSID